MGEPLAKPVGGFLASPLSTTRMPAGQAGVCVETDAEGFIRPSYNATGGASKAMRRGNFHRWDTNETLAVHR
jgi:hypothetical protein